MGKLFSPCKMVGSKAADTGPLHNVCGYLKLRGAGSDVRFMLPQPAEPPPKFSSRPPLRRRTLAGVIARGVGLGACLALAALVALAASLGPAGTLEQVAAIAGIAVLPLCAVALAFSGGDKADRR